jgi:hypothetical protein
MLQRNLEERQRREGGHAKLAMVHIAGVRFTHPGDAGKPGRCLCAAAPAPLAR